MLSTGGAHLAWGAVEAFIVPVQVDEHSVESLDLMMRMLTETHRGDLLWDGRAGILGAEDRGYRNDDDRRQKPERGDSDAASRMYIERASDRNS